MAQVQVAPEFRTAPRSLITAKVDRSRMVPTLGALNPIVSKYADLGEVDGALPVNHIQLLLRRPAERQDAFDAQVEALHTRGNASFHKWLTPAVVGSEFGPSDADLATVTGYLRSEGFTVNYTGTSGLYVDFSGTAAQVEHTFETKLHSFHVPNVEGVRYAAVQQASLPEALTPAVVGLVALSNVMSGHTNYRKVVPPAQRESLPVGVRADGSTPEDTVSSTNYAVSPQDFYTIYNENPILTAGYTGTGVTIAVLEESAINTADVTTFRTTYGVTPNTPVSLVVDTGYGANTCTAPAQLEASGEEGEAILDAEWASSIAPGANIIFMQCAGDSVPLGVFYSAEAVIDNNLADTMSLSYGTYETYSSGTEDALANLLWEQAASQGETVVVSSGDSGAATEDGNGSAYAVDGITVNGFSSTAWNVSAGGTDFMDTFNGGINPNSNYQIANYWNTTVGTINSAKSYIPEMPWNDSCGSSIYSYYYYGGVTEPAAYFCGQNKAAKTTAAGGSGPSIVNARPSWQAGTVYGLPSTATYTGRLQPDISLFASNGFWYHDLPSYESDDSGTSYAGGTSFVAPQLAGVFALLNQYTGERQGQPNYVLYNMAAAEYGSGTTPVANNCNGSGATAAVPTSSSPGTSCVFYDIEAGSNSVVCRGATDCYVLANKTYGVLSTSSSTSSPAFNTGAGWDMATGIGSINIANLFANWQKSANQYTPTVVLTDTTATTVAYGSIETLTATVSGSGSYPTGSVQFTYTGPTSGTLGTSAITGSSGCSNTSTCTEAATETIYPAAAPSATPYVFKANYNSTNENYISATSGTVSITVTKQTPKLAVQNVNIITGTATATLTATITYLSSAGSVAPTGMTPFTVTGGSGGTVNGSCTATSATVVTCSATYPTSTLVAGNYPINATYSGDSNYNAITTAATGTLNVGSGTVPTITFSIGSPQYTLYPTVALSSTSNSSGAVTYSISGTTGTAAGTISGSTLTLTAGGTGTITVLLTQAAAGSYRAGSMSSTFTVYAGSVWVGDSTDDVSTFAQPTGTAITASPGLSGGGVGTIPFPLASAFDASGDYWIASSTGVSEFKPSAAGPVAVSSTPYTVGGITTASPPLALAVDGLGVIWVSNYNGTISALSNAGAAISPSTGYTASGVNAKYGNLGGIAVDLSGNVWVTNSVDGSVTEVLGVAAPVAPMSTSLANGTTGTRP